MRVTLHPQSPWPKVRPFIPNVAQFSEQRQFTALFAEYVPELRHRLISAENDNINLRKNCGNGSVAVHAWIMHIKGGSQSTSLAEWAGEYRESALGRD